jgi:hypothetical protein
MKATVLLLIGLGAACTSQGSTLISNADQPASWSSIPNVYANQWVAAPFLTGANAAQLNSISLNVFTEIHFPPTGSFFVAIYSDDNGLPGQVLLNGNLNGPSQPLDGFHTYTATEPLALAESTLYWVVASSDTRLPSAFYGWYHSTTTTYTSAYDWTFFDHSAWGVGGNTWTTFNGNPLEMSIDGTIVPEPSFCVLVAVFGALILAKKNG